MIAEKTRISGGETRSGALRRHITDNYSPGDKLPTEAELVKFLGVSRYAVLKELTQLVAEGVVERRQGSGTFMSKSGGNGVNAKNIAFIANEFDSFMNAEIMRGVDDYLRGRELNLVLLNSDYDKQLEERNLVRALEERFGGVLALLDPDAGSIAAAKRLADASVPFVQIDRHFPEVGAPCVELNHERGAYDAVSHLLDLGHTRIAHITFPESEWSHLSSVVQRLAGYKRALSDHGVDFLEKYVDYLRIMKISRLPLEDMKDLLAYEATHRLLSLPKPPTAIFVLYDEIAHGIYKAVRNHGLSVPQDISVIGFDDDLMGRYLDPPLTTIRQPFREIGAKAAGLLETLMEGEKVSNPRITVSGELVVRESVRKVN